MFLPSFSDLRKKLLSEVQIETLAHLGPHAFEDIGGEKVNTVLLVCERGRGNVVNPGLYFNLRDTSDKISSLLSVVKLDGRDPNTYQVSQDAFLGVEGAPFQYWTSSRVLELLQECPPLKAFCDVKTGMRLSRKHIWTRLHWEVPSGQNSPRWVPYARGGEVRKWYGNLEWLLDWSERAQQEYGKKKYHRNQDYYFRRGLTWTDITSREFSLRYLPEGCVFDVGGPSLFPKELDFWYVLAFLNTRLVNYILNKLNATFHYYVSDVERVPVCLPDVETQEICANLARLATEIQTEIVEHELDQPDFQITLLEKFSNQPSRNPTLESAFSCVTHFSEDKLLSLIIIGDCIEKLICQLYQLHDRDRATIFREQGVPPTLHPILVDHELIPHGLEPEIYDYLESLPRVELAPKELAALQEKLKQLYVDEDNSIRKVSTVLEINPVSVVALCREMGLVNPKNLRHAVEDFLTHHIWELCKRDEDGIIPYDAGLRNASLLEQVRGEIEAVFSAERAVDIEAELDEILGRGGLAGWLENPFFKKHTSQFKKRPILWQIVSPNHQFRALVYYHKLDADTLPKIRSQYLWPLLERARTQLRAAREQDPPDMKTIGDLEDYIADLEACDTALESVIQGVVLSLSKGTVDVNLPDWANGPYRNGQAPYHPDLDDGVKVNILPLQAAGLLPVKKVV